MNHTFQVLRLVFVVIDDSAIVADNVDRQADHTLNMLLYHVPS